MSGEDDVLWKFLREQYIPVPDLWIFKRIIVDGVKPKFIHGTSLWLVVIAAVTAEFTGLLALLVLSGNQIDPKYPIAILSAMVTTIIFSGLAHLVSKRHMSMIRTALINGELRKANEHLHYTYFYDFVSFAAAVMCLGETTIDKLLPAYPIISIFIIATTIIGFVIFTLSLASRSEQLQQIADLI